MVDMTIEIVTTRDIARQMLRHRSFVFQEFSQRYAEATEFVECREARMQDTKNRQNSIKTDNEKLQNTFGILQELALIAAKDAYTWAIENGIAKEQARAVLPEGLTISRLYMKGNLRSWIHYCQLRMDPATQLEHREVASACWDIVCDQFPSVKELLSGDLTQAST
jgi:thymidylate synthase (FAD)